MNKEELTPLEILISIVIISLGITIALAIIYLVFLPFTYLACYALSIPFEFKFVLIPALLYFFIKSLLKKQT